MSRFQMLSDTQWELIAPMLPTRTGRAGRPFADARAMVEAIIYRYRCGIAWRDLPEVYGPWQTVWTWHRRLAEEGTWDTVLATLTAAADAEGLRSSPLWWCSGWILRWGCQALSSRAVSVSVPTSLPVSSTGVRRQRARTSRPR